MACVFNIFGFSFDAIKGINSVKIYEIFVIVFCILAAWFPIKIFRIASSLRQIYKKLSLVRSRNTDSKGILNREKIFQEYEFELQKNKIVSTIWNDYKATFIDMLDKTKEKLEPYKDKMTIKPVIDVEVSIIELEQMRICILTLRKLFHMLVQNYQLLIC